MFRIASLFTLAALVAGLAGCPASVNGEVDGEGVPALLSAFFLSREADFGAEDTLFSLSAVGISVLDACNQATLQNDNFNDLLDTNFKDIEDAAGDPDDIAAANEEFAQGQVDYEVEHFPTDYWTVSVSLQSLDDGNFEDADQGIDLEDADDSSLDPTDDKDIVANVSICRTNDHPEVDEPDDNVFVVKRDQDCFVAKKGSVVVSAFDGKSSLSLTAEVELTALDEDGAIKDIDDDAGEVVVQISAGRCETLEKSLDDTQDIIDDAIGG